MYSTLINLYHLIIIRVIQIYKLNVLHVDYIMAIIIYCDMSCNVLVNFLSRLLQLFHIIAYNLLMFADQSKFQI